MFLSFLFNALASLLCVLSVVVCIFIFFLSSSFFHSHSVVVLAGNWPTSKPETEYRMPNTTAGFYLCLFAIAIPYLLECGVYAACRKIPKHCLINTFENTWQILFNECKESLNSAEYLLVLYSQLLPLNCSSFRHCRRRVFYYIL